MKKRLRLFALLPALALAFALLPAPEPVLAGSGTVTWKITYVDIDDRDNVLGRETLVKPANAVFTEADLTLPPGWKTTFNKNGYIQTKGENGSIVSFPLGYTYFFDEEYTFLLKEIEPPKTPAPVKLDPEYDHITPFTDGVAWLIKDGKSGIIDTNGTIVVPPSWNFHSLGAFDGGVAWVLAGGMYGLVSKTGAVLAEPQFKSVGEFGEDGLALVVSDAGVSFIRRDGSYQIYGLQYDTAHKFSGGLARVGVRDAERSSYMAPKYFYGYVDALGQEAMAPQWNEAGDFTNGLAIVALGNKWGVIDEAGNYVLEPVYEAVKLDDGSPDYIYFQEGSRVGVAGRGGNIIHEAVFGVVTTFGACAVTEFRERDGGPVGLIDAAGNIVSAAQWDSAKTSAGYDRAIVSKDGLAGLVDFSGNVTVPATWWDAIGFYGNGIYLVRKGSLLGFIDGDGNVIAEPVWEQLYTFDSSAGDPMYGIEKGGKFGLLDRDGGVAVYPAWDELKSAGDGYTYFKLNGKYGLYDLTEQRTVLDAAYSVFERSSDGRFITYGTVENGTYTKNSDAHFLGLYDTVTKAFVLEPVYESLAYGGGGYVLAEKILINPGAEYSKAGYTTHENRIHALNGAVAAAAPEDAFAADALGGGCFAYMAFSGGYTTHRAVINSAGNVIVRVKEYSTRPLLAVPK
jgi:hypothetical protein